METSAPHRQGRWSPSSNETSSQISLSVRRPGRSTQPLSPDTPNLEGAHALSALWSAARSRDIFRLPLNPFRLIGRLKGEALYENAGLRRLIEAHLNYERIEDAKIGLRIVATDFETGHAKAFHSGHVVDAILASTALPGLFPPVEVEGRIYVDGGIADNVPISPAVGAGADEVYVIHVGFNCPIEKPRAIDVLWRSIGLLLNRTLAADVEQFANRANIVVVPPLCVPATPLWNLSHSRFLIAEARQTVGAFLDAQHRTAQEQAS